MPGQPHTAQDVDLEQALPSFIGFVKEAHGFVDAEVVDEDVDVRELADRLSRALDRTVVGDEPFELCARERHDGSSDGGINTGSGAAVDDDTYTFSRPAKRAISRPMPPVEAVTRASFLSS